MTVFAFTGKIQVASIFSKILSAACVKRLAKGRVISGNCI
jgi:hypothetical protein